MYTTPINSQVFIQIGPVSFAIIGVIFFKEILTWKHIVGFIVFLIGYIMFYVEQFSIINTGEDYIKGAALILGAGLAWAGFATIQKRELKYYSPNQINVFIYGICSLLFLPFISYTDYLGHTSLEWGLLIFLGLNTILAYGSLAIANKYTEANRISVILTMNPIITFIIMGVLTYKNVSWIDNEYFSTLTITGAGIVLLGAILVILASRNKSKVSQNMTASKKLAC